MTLSSANEKYHYIDDVGCGTFGEVGKFRRQSDRKIVAVKRLSGAYIWYGIREARFLASLREKKAYDHHIVRFFESFEDPVYFYIVEEALDQTLDDFQQRNGLENFEIRDIRTIVLQVVIALAKLRDLGIVHADIKQDNIMLVNQRSQPFRLKLIDFGLSLTDSELASLPTPYIQPRFIRAPEVILGYPCSRKIDMWSLGCVAGEMALGPMVFPADCEMELAHKIFETRGLPSTTMLDSAIKTSMFFDRVDKGNGAHGWQLKPYQITPRSNRRSSIPANLEELQRGSEEQEIVDRRCLADLINRMLILEPEHRISPNQALRHPFFTMEHLRQWEYRQYYNFSLQGYRKAGVSVPQVSSVSGDSSEETVPGVSKKKRSQRRSLRSFFTRLFTLRRKKQPAAAQGSEDALEGPSNTAVRGGLSVKDGTQFHSETDISSSACATEESRASSNGSSVIIHEEPPKKTGALRRWLRRVAVCFAGCWPKKSAST